VTDLLGMFGGGVTLSNSNYDSLLIGWNNLDLIANRQFSGGNSQFCSLEAIEARDNMINSFNWEIWDGGQDTTCIPIGIEEDNMVNFTVSPNPASNQLEVQLAKMINGTLSLVDISGRILEKRSLDNGKKRYTIEIREYVAGIYFVEIQSEGIKIKSEKLIIQ